MTTEAMDLLDLLSNPNNIKQAGQLRDRPMDRFPAIKFRADILGKGSDLQVETRRPQNSNFDQTGVWLDINVTEVLQGKGELGEYRLWVRAPGPRRDGQQNADDNSELGQMMLAANQADGSVTSIRSLPGRKNVLFEEDMHKYMGRSQVNGEWVDREFKTYYYKLNFFGSAVPSNGAKPAEVTQDVIDTALGIIRATGEAGIPEKDFSLAASKVAALKPLWKSIGDGSFIRDQIKAGKVSQTADGNLATTD